MTNLKFITALLVLIFTGTKACCQQDQTARQFQNLGNEMYYAEEYVQAAHYYIRAAELSDFDLTKAGNYYNAACCFGLQNKPDSAIIFLNKSINHGITDKAHLLNDSDLASVRKHRKWNKTIGRIKETKSAINADPEKAKLVTTDIYNFWKAYDKAEQDTSNYKAIFKKYYFKKASPGMNSYMAIKVGTIDYFINHITSFPKFYASIRQNTFKVDEYKKDIMSAFQKLKSLYPDAKFPNVYFMIGAFTSGGTISEEGLLIGVNQYGETSNTDTQEFGFRERMMSQKLESIPNLVSHELIHFQQEGLARDTITLGYCINEGMADFIGELISGNNANQGLHEWAKGKENRIWNNFKKDMYLNRYSNWIANSGSDQVSSENLPDQGYWIGYQICKSYYDKSADKKKAIYDILNIKDYRLFLKESGWEEKVEKM